MHIRTAFGCMAFVLCFIAAISNGGKTTYFKKLLESAAGVFTEAPTRIIYFYNVFQPMYAEMVNSIENISSVQGLPQKSFIEEYGQSERSLLLVFDDMYEDVIGSRDICDLCLMLSHHLNISCIFTSHNIFTAGKFSKTIATNLHSILLGT